jgi:SAM-dependent methyltransferase
MTAVSNAVFEHFSDPGAALRELARVTKAGGVGVHQVDFRDHRDLDRPLEHLLFEPAVFRRLNERANTEYGSQLRRQDYDGLILDVGFAIEAYETNSQAENAYLDDFEPRLRRAQQSPYADRPREHLAELGGLFMLRRTG